MPVFPHRYDALIPESGLYRDPTDPALRTNPLQQLCREHLLAHTMVTHALYDFIALVLLLRVEPDPS